MAAKKKARRTAAEMLREFQKAKDQLDEKRRPLSGAEAARTPEGRAFIEGRPVVTAEPVNLKPLGPKVNTETLARVRAVLYRREMENGQRVTLQQAIHEALGLWLKRNDG